MSAGATAEELASAKAALDSARANYKMVRDGPPKEELVAAQAARNKARATVPQAQTAHHRARSQADIEMPPESLNLQKATIELERAQANCCALANRPLASELAAGVASGVGMVFGVYPARRAASLRPIEALRYE